MGDAEDRIAQNVNTDEAAVLGAAYYGAGLSRQFKMKSLNVTEISLEDFRMGEEVIFEKGAKLGSRRTISLPAGDDAVIEFSQGSRPVLSVQLVHVATALSNFTSPSPVVNLTMRLDPRGHLSAANAVLVSNVTAAKEGGVAGALKGLFGGKKDKVEVESEDVEEFDVKGEKVVLRFKEKHLGVRPMTGEEKRTTMAGSVYSGYSGQC